MDYLADHDKRLKDLYIRNKYAKTDEERKELVQKFNLENDNKRAEAVALYKAYTEKTPELYKDYSYAGVTDQKDILKEEYKNVGTMLKAVKNLEACLEEKKDPITGETKLLLQMRNFRSKEIITCREGFIPTSTSHIGGIELPIGAVGFEKKEGGFTNEQGDFLLPDKFAELLSKNDPVTRAKEWVYLLFNGPKGGSGDGPSFPGAGPSGTGSGSSGSSSGSHSSVIALELNNNIYNTDNNSKDSAAVSYTVSYKDKISFFFLNFMGNIESLSDALSLV